MCVCVCVRLYVIFLSCLCAFNYSNKQFCGQGVEYVFFHLFVSLRFFFCFCPSLCYLFSFKLTTIMCLYARTCIYIHTYRTYTDTHIKYKKNKQILQSTHINLPAVLHRYILSFTLHTSVCLGS